MVSESFCWGSSTLRQSTYMRRRKGEPSTSGFKYIWRLARRVTFISFKLPSVSLGDDLRLGDFVSRRLGFCPCAEVFLNRNVLTLDVSSSFAVAWREVVVSASGDTTAAAVGGREGFWWCGEGIGVGGAMGTCETGAIIGVFTERCWCKTWSWPSMKSVSLYIYVRRNIYWNDCLYSLRDGMNKVDGRVLEVPLRVGGYLKMLKLMRATTRVGREPYWTWDNLERRWEGEAWPCHLDFWGRESKKGHRKYRMT